MKMIISLFVSICLIASVGYAGPQDRGHGGGNQGHQVSRGHHPPMPYVPHGGPSLREVKNLHRNIGSFVAGTTIGAISASSFHASFSSYGCYPRGPRYSSYVGCYPMGPRYYAGPYVVYQPVSYIQYVEPEVRYVQQYVQPAPVQVINQYQTGADVNPKPVTIINNTSAKIRVEEIDGKQVIIIEQ